MQTLNFDVSGMSCGGCTGKVQRALDGLDGVSQAQVSLNPGLATVMVDPARVTPAQVAAAITRLGFAASARPPASGVPARS